MQTLFRRIFLTFILVFCSVTRLMTGLVCAAENIAVATTVPAENAIVTIIETKVICREPGKYLGQGSEYGVNQHGHPIILKRVVESDRYLGWATLARTRTGELIVAFSGDRDAHVCPWGKTQIIRSLDQGKTWTKDRQITRNSPFNHTYARKPVNCLPNREQ